MKTVVQKYGGSSVSDLEHIRRVAEMVVARKRGGEDVVVVVSAMGKTTDALISQARQVTPDPPRRELDMLVTAGERISMALLSMAIQDLGEASISFTGSQCGIITDENHQGARVLEVRPWRVKEELGRGRIVIVAGYQGVSRHKEITTLGRGGSDTTAVALAAALEASACEIYSDVDGVYSADPNLCPQARLLTELKYTTMQTMAGAGAKVLNVDAVEFARRAGIVIAARKTGDPSGRQTLVSDQAREPSGVVAVVGASAVTRLHGAPGRFSTLLTDVALQGGRVMAAAAGAALELLVDRTSIPGRDERLLAAAAAKHGLSAEPVGVVTLVGSGLLSRGGVAERIEASAARLHSQPQGAIASDTAQALIVEPATVDAWVRALHAELVEGALRSSTS
ncbi:MAG: aspartate kinase [Deltaproteobacteria bacterium]|nr:aspartate kinase [Deltaproteobacteria bacterium]